MAHFTGVGAMKLIVQPFAGGFELCARLGIVFVRWAGGGKIIHAVLDDSPSARAGLEPRDIVIAVNETQLDTVRFLTFSDRRPSELNLKIFVARYFTIASIMVRVQPKPYRPIEDIVAEAARAIAARPMPPKVHYVNPRFAETREVLSMLRRRRRR